MFSGVITPVVTMLDENKKLDLNGVEALIEHLISGGVNGMLIMGSIGEFFALSQDEKEAYVDFVIEKVAGRVPVLVGTGGTVLEDVIKFSQYAEKAGADAVLLVSPYYFKLDDESLYRYFASVAEAVDLPVILYNFPDCTVHDLSPELIKRLAMDYKHIVGVKDTVDNISHTRSIIQAVKPVRPDFCVLSGYDEYFLGNLMAGGDGIIGGLSNLYPAFFSDMYASYQKGDFEALKEAQLKVNGMMKIYEQTKPFVAAIKMGVKLAGVSIVPEVKSPGVIASEEETKKIKAIIDAFGPNA